MFLFPKVRDDRGVVVGAQGGQRLLDVELPGPHPQAGHRGQVLSADLAAAAPHPPHPRAAEGGQEEPEEVLRPVHRQGQDAAEQGQQGAGGQAPVHDGAVHRLARQED